MLSVSVHCMASRMERSKSFVPSNESVKIGGLWKRSQGLSRFTKPNYRHRVFILTEQALSYYSGTVDVSRVACKAVRVADRAAVFQASLSIFCRAAVDLVLAWLHVDSHVDSCTSNWMRSPRFVYVARGPAERKSESGHGHCS